MTETRAAASYHDIADALRRDIASGALAPGAPVPSQAEVGTRFGVAPAPPASPSMSL